MECDPSYPESCPPGYSCVCSSAGGCTCEYLSPECDPTACLRECAAAGFPTGYCRDGICMCGGGGSADGGSADAGRADVVPGP